MRLNNSLKAKLKKYKLTEAEYASMLEKSGNKCYICGKPPKNRALHIDHNHKTGKVRGLLCYICNTKLIGRLGDREDSIQLFLKASEYLRNAE